MNNPKLMEDSDSSDEDYVPEKDSETIAAANSEENSDSASNEDDDTLPRTRKKNRRRPTKKQKYIEDDDSPKNTEPKQVSEEEKKKIDDIWADFMKDTGFKSKNDKNKDTLHPSAKPEKTVNSPEKPTEKVKITQVFNFAGENVVLEKEVPSSSRDSKLLTQKSIKNDKIGNSKNPVGGISGILNNLGKKPKISTLEKSKLDWDKFKKEENLEEELQTHNRGKDGYLEKQDFLERADLRRFEIERKIRTIERNKRINNS